MTNILPPRYMSAIQDFFTQTENAVLSLGAIDFPKICALQNIVNDGLKKKPSAQQDLMKRIHTLMDSLCLYFLPIETYFSPSLNLYEITESIKQKKEIIQRKQKRSMRDIQREEEQTKKLSTSKINLYSKEGRRKLKEINCKKERLAERIKKSTEAFNDFQLPSLEELNKYETLPLPPIGQILNPKFNTKNYNTIRDKLYKSKISFQGKTLSEDNTLYDKYQSFWRELCKFTNYPYTPEWIFEKKLTFSPYIKIEDFWLSTRYSNEMIANSQSILRKEKCLLAKLYDVLVENKCIEGGKSKAFISIFTGFRFDYEKDFPIKWLCSMKRKESSDGGFNLAALYFLIVALKDWEAFLSLINNEEQPLIKECLTMEEKEIIAQLFADRNSINPKHLRFTPNKSAMQKIKMLLLPLIYN